ncbi:hypothetical protein K437DRAFT_257870 [Tilletiaria anomala UBC 951]|uniref:Cytochrome b mRNA-processing protein 4 n=1 Tax=Tilletiaria anomala (strain ATCC 24038 / CBS 436.72 / UBC 951) TaxID=1037660 RepID=A0A066VQ59_TILAU|nr:uncharacterized protein K437DRAFT_257870 [Tilletiaria anomala UBC 951]KDN42388.1 hypothetical protein K437DRAFT_257870 [Tilletiaria anomala UBC 951]
MSKPVPWGRGILGGAAIVALGWAIMKGTTPSEKEFYDKLSPDLKRQVDQQRQAAARKAALAEQIARAREQDDSGPVWAASKEARDSRPPPRR